MTNLLEQSKKIKWLMQTNLLSYDNIAELQKVFYENAIDWTECTVIPFSEDIEIHGEIDSDLIIPYGSTKLTKLALKKNWKGVFFDYNNFRINTWNKNRTDMLNQDCIFSTVKDISSIPAIFNAKDDELFFIRPVMDLKEFNGTVTTAKEIKNWMNSIESLSFDISSDCEIIISHPKKLTNEARYFIVGGKVVSGSYYRIYGQLLAQPVMFDNVIEDIQKLADKWLPNSTCVMDVALVDDEYKVIEFNCFNSSGFYKNDINKIVMAVTNQLRNKNG